MQTDFEVAQISAAAHNRALDAHLEGLIDDYKELDEQDISDAKDNLYALAFKPLFDWGNDIDFMQGFAFDVAKIMNDADIITTLEIGILVREKYKETIRKYVDYVCESMGVTKFCEKYL